MMKVNYGANAPKDLITHTPNSLRNAKKYAIRPNFMTVSKKSV